MVETFYYCKFDTKGRRTTSIDELQVESYGGEAKLLADGYVKVSLDDYMYYVGNKGMGDNGTGYIRGADGKPTSAPPIVTLYCYYDNGTQSKTVNDEYQAQDGEAIFSKEPTTDELKNAFPSVAGTMTYTLKEALKNDDVITLPDVCGDTIVTLTVGKDLDAGTDVKSGVVNLVAALNNKLVVANLYNIASTDSTFTLTEKMAGAGNTPHKIESDFIDSGEQTISKQGYETVQKLAALDKVNNSYIENSRQNMRALSLLDLKRMTDDEKAKQKENLMTQQNELDAWFDKTQEEIING